MVKIYGSFASLCTRKMLSSAINQAEEEIHIITPFLSLSKNHYTFEDLVLCFLIHNDVLRRIRISDDIAPSEKRLLFDSLSKYISFTVENEAVFIQLADSSSDVLKEITVQSAERFKAPIDTF